MGSIPANPSNQTNHAQATWQAGGVARELKTLADVRIDPAWAFKVPEAVAMRRLALPLCVVDGVLEVAMADPSDTQALDAIRAATGLEARPIMAPADELREALLRAYGDVRASRRQDTAADPVATVERILRAAAMRQASDIHINPGRDGAHVRLRIDGVIEDFTTLPPDLAPAVVSRVKVMAGMDIAERRAPQDGAIAWTPPDAPGAAQPAPADIRVATLPVRHGERVTLRLLEAGRDRLTIDSLGMSPPDMALFRAILRNPRGLVLLTGPTGSGKTTTLYAAIRELLASAPLNILTVEDPVEYEIEGVCQAEVDAGDKVSFARALRSLLRHDPDVIMIGEIRDETSLDTAVKAALTGHLVLSTLHAGDAVGAVTRLRDMGLAPHLLGATLRLSASQRLVRRLCPHCREPFALDGAGAALLGRPDLEGRTAWKPHGCLACAGRGHAGRIGVFELVAPDAELASRISAGAGEDELRAALARSGARTLADDAIAKLLSGETDLNELKVIDTIGSNCHR